MNLLYSLKYLIYIYDHELAVEEHIFFKILKASCLNATFFKKNRTELKLEFRIISETEYHK